MRGQVCLLGSSRVEIRVTYALANGAVRAPVTVWAGVICLREGGLCRIGLSIPFEERTRGGVGDVVLGEALGLAIVGVKGVCRAAEDDGNPHPPHDCGMCASASANHFMPTLAERLFYPPRSIIWQRTRPHLDLLASHDIFSPEQR